MIASSPAPAPRRCWSGRSTASPPRSASASLPGTSGTIIRPARSRRSPAAGSSSATGSTTMPATAPPTWSHERYEPELPAAASRRRQRPLRRWLARREADAAVLPGLRPRLLLRPADVPKLLVGRARLGRGEGQGRDRLLLDRAAAEPRG